MARPFLSMVGLGLWSLNWTILSTFKHPTLTTTCWRPHLNIVMLTVGSTGQGTSMDGMIGPSGQTTPCLGMAYPSLRFSKNMLSCMCAHRLVSPLKLICELAAVCRGRYNVELHLSFLRLQGQANDFKIQYSSVVRLFLLPKVLPITHSSSKFS